jgi:hypothetical protein
MKQNHKRFLAQQFLLFIILAGTTIDSWSVLTSMGYIVLGHHLGQLGYQWVGYLSGN